MKKKAFFILTLLMILLLTINVFADNMDSASNYLAFDEDINITKEVLGDVYSAGKNINVKDNVDGDVIGLGEIIDITSNELKGNIRCGAQTLNINSRNVKNITSFGQNVNIGRNTEAKAIYLWGENIDFEGNCEGLYASGSTIIINGRVNGDVNVACDELIISDRGDITGNIKVYSPKEPKVNSNVSMNDIEYIKIEESQNRNKLTTSFVFEKVKVILASLLLGIVLYSIFKKFFRSNDDLLVKEPLSVVLGGVASFILVPIVSLLLFVTVIGLPLGMISLIMYFILIYLSPVIIGIIIGRLILKNKNPYLQVVTGVLIIRLLSILPMIGGFVWIVSGIITQGLVLYNTYQSVKYKEI